MTVYVDDCASTLGGFSEPFWHMIADTREELHNFAKEIGAKRRQFMDPADYPESCIKNPAVARCWAYRLTAEQKAVAIEHGAIEVDKAGFNQVIKNRKEF